jgi:hypothetical protein
MASIDASSLRNQLRVDRLLAGCVAALCGCGADLLPGEWVVPGEVPARSWTGEPESAFGTSLAARGGRFLVASPGLPRVEILGEGSVEGPAVAVWFDGDRALAGLLDLGVIEVPSGELLSAVPGARVFAGEDDLWVAATPEVVLASDGRSWSLRDTRAVAVGGGRVLAMACADGCAV